MEINEKKNAISAMMEASMGKIREMVDSNTVVGEPIVTADGVTLIPVSRLSFGFGCGGGDYGKQPDKLGAGAAAGVRVEPYGVSGGQGRRDPHAARGHPRHHHRRPHRGDGAAGHGSCGGLHRQEAGKGGFLRQNTFAQGRIYWDDLTIS